MRTMMTLFFFSSLTGFSLSAQAEFPKPAIIRAYGETVVELRLDPAATNPEAMAGFVSACWPREIACRPVILAGDPDGIAHVLYGQCQTAVEAVGGVVELLGSGFSFHQGKFRGVHFECSEEIIPLHRQTQARARLEEVLAAARLAAVSRERPVPKPPPLPPKTDDSCLGLKHTTCVVGLNVGGGVAYFVNDRAAPMPLAIGPGFWLRRPAWDIGLRLEIGVIDAVNAPYWWSLTADGGWEVARGVNLGAFATTGFGGEHHFGTEVFWVAFGPRAKVYPLVLFDSSFPLAVELDAGIFGRQVTAETEKYTAGDQGRLGIQLSVRPELDIMRLFR